MSVGPMVGLFLHDAYSFEVIFVCSLISCSLGFAMASLVKAPVKAPVKREPVSLDRFILVKGIPAGADLLMLSIPYGMTTTYVAMYARQIGITHGMGVFFTLMAVGMAISRIFSGRQVDKGRVTRVIAWGMYLVCLCFFALSSCALLMRLNETLSLWIFFGVALFLGVGFGTMFPAFNTLFDLLDLVGRRHRDRVAARGLYRPDQHVRQGLFVRRLPDGRVDRLFPVEGGSAFRAEQAALILLRPFFAGRGRSTCTGTSSR